MVNLGGKFDASNIEPTAALEIKPAGWYECSISESDIKDTKDGRGRYLQLTLTILDGPYAGQKFWDRLNLWNPSQQAVEISQRTLSAICHACGVMQFEDTAELHDKPMAVKVKVRPAKGEYDATNEVVGYKKAGTAPAASPAANSPAQTPAWGR